MKRAMTILLVACLTFGFTACSDEFSEIKPGTFNLDSDQHGNDGGEPEGDNPMD